MLHCGTEGVVGYKFWYHVLLVLFCSSSAASWTFGSVCWLCLTWQNMLLGKYLSLTLILRSWTKMVSHEAAESKCSYRSYISVLMWQHISLFYPSCLMLIFPPNGSKGISPAVAEDEAIKCGKRLVGGELHWMWNNTIAILVLSCFRETFQHLSKEAFITLIPTWHKE